MAFAALATPIRVGPVLRIPLVNYAVVDAIGDIQGVVDVAPLLSRIEGDGVGCIARNLGMKLVIEMDVTDGTPDFSVTTLQASSDGTNFSTVAGSLAMQATGTAVSQVRVEKTLTSAFLGHAPYLKLLGTAATLDGSNKATVLICLEIALADRVY